MSSDRLPAHVEVGGIIRRAEADGGFATILRKGDAERGAIILVVSRRGQHVACLERVLRIRGDYGWETVGPESPSSMEIAAFLEKRARFDEDLWAVELDIADAERFIAETTSTG